MVNLKDNHGDSLYKEAKFVHVLNHYHPLQIYKHFLSYIFQGLRAKNKTI